VEGWSAKKPGGFFADCTKGSIIAEEEVTDKRQANGELSLIGTGTRVEGWVSTEGSIRIDGTVIGDCTAKDSAAVGPSGSLEGNLSAKNVSLAGRVKGTITASEKLILESKSLLQGDIKATRLVVDEGAMFDGRCTMSTETGAQTKAPESKA
jgi:cytoskeletal protein CcmA (bactofilin family)